MYRKIVLATLLTAPTAVIAGTYAGIGYQGGQARVENDGLQRPVVDGRTLDQSGSESAGSLRLLAGYRFSDRWALEFTAQRPAIETSIEERVPGTGDDEEWESEVKALHLTLAPVYLHRLGEKSELRVTAGLLYGDYDLDRAHWIDVDNGPDQRLASSSTSRSKIGGTVGVGAAYTTPWRFDVLGEVTYQRTSVFSNAAVAVSAVYRF